MSETTPPHSGSRWWATLLAAGFPPMVGAYVTVRLYTENAELLVSGLQVLAEVMGLWLGLWALLFAGLQWGRGFGKALWLLAGGYTLFFLARDVAFPPPLASLDGTTLPTPSTGYLALEIGTLLVGLAAVLLLWRFGKAATAAAICTVVFGLSALGAARHLPAEVWQAAGTPDPDYQPPAQPPDVFHILFDSWQAVEYQFVRQEKGLGPFEDFIYFPDTVSNYNWTHLSFPSFLTGTLYRPEQDASQWLTAFQRGGLFRTFREAGYRVEVYGFHPDWSCTPDVHFARTSRQAEEELRQELGLSPRLGGELLRLVQMRGSPALFAARWSTHTDDDRVPPGTAHGYYSTVMFRQMVRELEQRPTGGTYRFFHLLIPHDPFVMGPAGNYVGLGHSTRWDQVLLVDTLMHELIAELKRLKRYDRSVLLLHADHGAWTNPNLSEQALLPSPRVRGRLEMKQVEGWHSFFRSPEARDGCRWPDSLVESRSRVTLMLKPSAQRGYRVMNVPAQLADVPRTLLGTVGIEVPDKEYADGVDLLVHPPSAERRRQTFVYGTGISGQSPLRHLQQYTIDQGRYRRGAVVPLRDDKHR